MEERIMSKWSITETWDGNFMVEEVSSVGPFGYIIGALIVAAMIAVVGPIFLITHGINNAIDEREEARALARIEAERKIEASIYDVSSEEKDGVIWGKARKEDYYGNEYSGEMREFCSWDNKEMATTFNLENDYKRFTGVIFTRPDQKEELTINFKIYGDGKCLYDSGDLRSTTPAIHLNLDITGVETLRFTAVSSGHEVVNAGVILMDAMVHAN
jgi:hypothetical protein